MTASASTLEAFAEPLDVARRRVMHVALRSRALASVYSDRDRRLAAQATLGILVSLLLASVFPVVLFAVAPLLFGVPHVASDVRYLLLRRSVPRKLVIACAAACVGFVILRASSFFLGESAAFARVESACALAWVCGAALYGSKVAAHKNKRRVALALVGVAALAVPTLVFPWGARLVFSHAHNLVAIALWVALFRRSVRVALLPLAMLAFCVVLALSGALLPIAQVHAFGLSLAEIGAWMAPGLGAKAQAGIAVSFVLLQGIHYAVWLGWIPQEDVKSEGTISFSMSVRSARRDFGRAGLALIVIAMVVVAAGALVNVHVARNTYLSLAMFHGYLELAMLAFFGVAGRPRATA